MYTGVVMKPKAKAVIGQDSLLLEVQKIFNIFRASKAELRPHFFLTGKSGSGKTFTIKQLAVKLEMEFLEINAAQLTKEGTSGNSLSKALSPLAQIGGKPTIVFVDEFDKLFISGNSNSSTAHETTTGVQNEFLKVLESDTSSVFGDYGKYIDIDISKTLFVFAGAFNNEEAVTLDKLRRWGVKTEFLGRVGLVYNTKMLTLEDLFTILNDSEVLSRYLGLFPEVKREDVVAVIEKHLKKNYSKNTLGARMVNTLIHQYFIKGGLLEAEEVEGVTFQETLEL